MLSPKTSRISFCCFRFISHNNARRRSEHLKLFLCFALVVILYLSFLYEIFGDDEEDSVLPAKLKLRREQLFKRPQQDVRTDVTYHQDYVKQHLRISNNIQEWWNYVHAQLGDLKNDVNSNTASKIEKILAMTSQYKQSLLLDMEDLISIEGSNTWAEEQNQRLANVVQTRLREIQNPRNCATALKVLCRIQHDCGFGCQLHHVTLCLLIAYATNRTLVLNSDTWKYNPSGHGGWEDLFEPLSQTCKTVDSNATLTYWPSYDPSKDVIVLKRQSYTKGPKFLPRAVPTDIAASLVHGEPVVWWVGQFVRYIFRPNYKLRKILSAHRRHIGFQHPVVGVHIRRTDKLNREASAHSVKEYMRHVAEYYDQMSLSEDVERRVYVATDEPGVIDEIKNKYPEYKILGDPNIVANASLASRFSIDGLLGIIIDLYFLSKSDYLVCTFSSQICRLAYEYHNAAGKGDHSLAFKSLDDIWFFAGGTRHVQRARLPHTAAGPGEISLAVGDEIQPAGNHWDGFCLGTLLGTEQRGLYPAFKVESIVDTYDGFPTYPNVR